MSDADIDSAISNRVWEQKSAPAPAPAQTYSIAPVSTAAPWDPLVPISPYLGQAQYGIQPPHWAELKDPGPAIGTALTRAGQALSGFLGDAWENLQTAANPMGVPTATGPKPTGAMIEEQMEKDIPGYIRPPSYMETFGTDQESPAIGQAKTLGPWLGGAMRASQGFVEATPRIAAMGAMGGAGMSPVLSGGLAFGYTEEGFDPKAFAIGAGIPLTGAMTSKLIDLSTKSLGMSNPAAQNFIKAVATTTVPAGAMFTEQMYDISSMEEQGLMTPEEADDARIEALFGAGYNIGGGPMGAEFKSTVRPPKIPQRRSTKPLAPIMNSDALNVLERSYLDAERDAIDNPIVVVGGKREYILDPDKRAQRSDDPFATSKTTATTATNPATGEPYTGRPMRANKRTGEIEVYPGELSAWLSGVPESVRGWAMRRRLNEEALHFATNRRQAAAFARNMSAFTRAIIARTYIGNYQGINPVDGKRLSDEELGYEGIRIFLQRMDREGLAETAEAALREKWTIRMLLAMDNALGAMHARTFGNPKGEFQRQILADVKKNLDVAKQAVSDGEIPVNARNKKAGEQQRLPYDDKVKEFFANMKLAQDDPEVMRQAQLELQDRAQEQPPAPAVGEADIRETRRLKGGQQEMDFGPSARNKMVPRTMEDEFREHMVEVNSALQDADPTYNPSDYDLRWNRVDFAASKLADIMWKSGDKENVFGRAKQMIDNWSADERSKVQQLSPELASWIDSKIHGDDFNQMFFPAARNKQLEFEGMPKGRDLEAERDYYRYMDLKRFGNTERFDPDTEETFRNDPNDVRARMEVIEKKYGGPPPEPTVEPTPGSVQGAIRYGPADDRRIIDAVAAGKKPFGELTVAVDSPEHKRVKRLVEAGKIDAKMHEFDGSWSPDGPSEKLVAIGLAPKGALEHMMRQREAAVKWEDYGELYGFTKQEISDFEYRSEHGDFPAMRKKVAKETRISVLLDAVRIYDEAIQAAKARDDQRGVETLTANRQIMLDRLDELTGDQQSFPAARNKKVPRELQSGMDFEGPTSMAPKAVKGPVEGATQPKWAPVSPTILEDSVRQHIIDNPEPSFDSFAKMAKDKWGIQPGQLQNVWQDKVWDALMGAKGAELTELVFKLDLGSKLKMQKNLEKMQRAAATGKGSAIQNAPSLSSGENLVIGKKMYGQIPDAPEIEQKRTEVMKQLESGRLLGKTEKAAPELPLKTGKEEKTLTTPSLFGGEDLRSQRTPSEMEQELKAKIVADLKSGKFPEGISKSTRTSLDAALKRAETARKSEEEYNKLFTEAKDLREQLRNAGFTNIDEKGNPIGGGTPNIAAKGIGRRLLHARIQMDKLADPGFYSRKSERESVTQQKIRQTIYPTDPVTGEQTSIHPIGTKVFTKQTGSKVKVPEYEEMARPGFSAGLPPRKGSAETRAGQLRRLRVIAAIGERLIAQQESTQEKAMSREITPDDLAYYRGAEALRPITAEDRANLPLLSNIIASAPQENRATVSSKGVGGTKITQRRKGSESTTRNVVVVRNRNTGEVFFLSAYEGGDGVVRIMDPRSGSLKRQHSPITAAFVHEYQPIYSLQLDAPVRALMQKFGTEDQFRRDFVHESKGRFQDVEQERSLMKLATPDEVSSARQRLAARMALGVTDPEVFKSLDEQLRQKQAELSSSVTQKGMSAYTGGKGLVEKSLNNPNVSPQEAGAIYDALKLWKHEDPEAIVAEFNKLREQAGKQSEFETQGEQQARSKSRLAAIALQKVINQMTGSLMGDEQIIRMLPKLGEGRQEFIDNMVKEFTPRPEPPHEIGTQRQAIGGGLEPDPQELTMRGPQDVLRENQLRRAAGLRPVGPQRDPAVHTPEPYRRQEQMMSPEEAEFVRQQRMTGGEVRPGIDTPQHTVGYYPHAFNKRAKAAADAIAAENRGQGVMAWYSGWMGDRLSEGGGVRSMQFAKEAKQIIDRQKELEGALAPHTDKALKLVGAPGPAGTFLNGSIEQTGMGKGTALSHAQASIENWPRGAVPGWHGIPAYAQEAADAARSVNYMTGRMVAPVSPGFRPGGKYENHWNNLGYDAIMTGDGPIFKKILEGEAWANRRMFALPPGTPAHIWARLPATLSPVMERAAFRRAKSALAEHYAKFREEMSKPTPNMSIIDTINQDHKRHFPYAVTRVKVGRPWWLGGGWRQVRHDNMFNYLKSTVKRATHARAFREYFPAGKAGQEAYSQLRQDIGHEFQPEWQGGEESAPSIMKDFDDMTRALQGHPTDVYTGNWWGLPRSMQRPGNFLPDLARTTNEVIGNLMSRAVLSKQVITQSGELAAGSTPRYLGYRNYGKAAGMMLKDLLNQRQLYKQMENQGTVNRVIYDWSFDPKSPIQSSAKIAGNVMSAAFMENLFNEAQEGLAAATAKVTANNIRTGNLSNWEKRHLPNTFKAMGFDVQEVRQLMAGRPEMLDMFERRAAAFLTGGNKHVAEGSALGANRLFNTIFRYQSYPMMKANQLRKDWNNFTGARNSGARKVALEQLTRNLFFNTAQGAITTMVGAMFGGAAAWNIKQNEAKDQKLKFLLESLFASQSGPLYLAWRNSDYGGGMGLADQVGRMAFPYSMGKEFLDFANGSGPYKDQSIDSRMDTFFSRKVPGLGPARVALATVGLSNENVEYKAARDAFYRWRNSEGWKGGAPGETPKAEDKEFRKFMRQAQAAVISGNKEDYREAIMQAVGAKDAKAAATSLRGRRLGIAALEKDLDMKYKLIDRIGEDAYRTLRFYDTMLDEAADSLTGMD